MRTDELTNYLFDKHGGKYGIMPPPMTDREFTDLIIQHFIPDYYSVNPIGREQFNTEALYMILEKTQPKFGRCDGKINLISEKIKSIFGGNK